MCRGETMHNWSSPELGIDLFEYLVSKCLNRTFRCHCDVLSPCYEDSICITICGHRDSCS